MSKGPTVVSLTFDDGTSDQYVVRPMLARYSMHATFFVNTNKIQSGPDYLTWHELSDLAADGNEIGGHTLDHVELTKVDAAELQRQVSDDRQALISRDFRATAFAYPYGARDSSMYPFIQRCGYHSARRSYGLCPVGQVLPNCTDPVAETLPAQNTWEIRTIPSVRISNTLVDLTSVVTRTENAGGGWVILVFHHVCDRYEYSVDAETLVRFLDWLAPRRSRGTKVQTMGDVVDHFLHE